jgi:uronate dehydrogenase
LGYDPRDDAEAYADSVRPRPEDEVEASHVGGPLVLDSAAQPAF